MFGYVGGQRPYDVLLHGYSGGEAEPFEVIAQILRDSSGKGDEGRSLWRLRSRGRLDGDRRFDGLAGCFGGCGCGCLRCWVRFAGFGDPLAFGLSGRWLRGRAASHLGAFRSRSLVRWLR